MKISIWMRVVVIVILATISISCRKTYICTCTTHNSSFENVFEGATKREANDLCDAAEIAFVGGNPGISCEITKVIE
ncbi:MAG: hypothetical protein JJT77_09900 [Crocinitomicaceae bacterium]|nr:hypothetical protein [Crocinitomicaceae bacterium]